MFLGQYTPLFDTAISPWTTLGPLSVVISISLAVEAFSDYKRHQNDHATNEAPVTLLLRSDGEQHQERDATVNRGKDITVSGGDTRAIEQPRGKAGVAQQEVVGYCTTKRKEIRQGHFVLVKNREMVPGMWFELFFRSFYFPFYSLFPDAQHQFAAADLVLLASSNDQGGAYIETSSIDGETNLKLRLSPTMSNVPSKETLVGATKRLASISVLGNPKGTSALKHPSFLETIVEESVCDTTGMGEPSEAPEEEDWGRRPGRQKSFKIKKKKLKRRRANQSGNGFVANLTSEPPNASVHTFSGKLTYVNNENDSVCNIPLGAENMLLRGAVIRNTEWVIGLACFTGTDTKLVRNSFDTPSKFSQLDQLINKTVVAILIVMFLCIFYLASYAVAYNEAAFPYLFYAGFNENESDPWPFLPHLDPPTWQTRTNNWMQFFFMYVTLLNNFIPLSLYVSVEMVQFVLLWLVYSDVEMYDDTTNTRSLARSTIVSDLGRIQYIFSDKTGTLTQNVMRFKRCSVDGLMFGSPITRTRPTEATASVDLTSPFHPLRQLRVGKFPISPGNPGFSSANATQTGALLTFNSEMFLRVMCLCHTVVVEKDIDKKETISSGTTVRDPTIRGLVNGNEKNSDGAPMGFAYQAESPDEGALVSAASSLFGFQVVTRDSSGIRLSIEAPSHLQNKQFVDELKAGHASLESAAMETAHSATRSEEVEIDPRPRQEVWSILAVNKFDSDRKRMSILLRSPPELGNLPILFCKGADSAMLDSEVCGIQINDEDGGLDTIGEEDDIEHSLRMQVC